MIPGVTRDASGTPLGACTVDLYLTASKAFVATTTSDASGTFSFNAPSDLATYYLVAYKAGSPDVYATSPNTLVASQPT